MIQLKNILIEDNPKLIRGVYIMPCFEDIEAYLRRKCVSKNRIKKYHTILKLMYKLGINSAHIGMQTLDDFFFYLQDSGLSDETKYTYWCIFKKIVIYTYPNMIKYFSNYVIKIRPKIVNILTVEEINSISEYTNSLRDNIFVCLLYEGGFRFGEIRNISRNDVIFDEHGAKITVNGKTGVRQVRVVCCAEKLKRFFEEDKRDMPFCFSETFANRHILKPAAEKAGITKRVYPHLFRHSRATHLSKYLNDRQLCIFFGWSKTSDMPARYSHLTMEDVDEKIINMSK